MPFVPIGLHEYARMNVESNPGTSLADITSRLQRMLKDYRAGAATSA